MSEVRLVVREAECDWSGTVHGSCADQAIAALSADPLTLAELEVASDRFSNPSRGGHFFTNLSPGLDSEPYDAGLVVIDLVARLVVVDSTYSSPDPKGTVRYHDGCSSTNTVLRYHLADDWKFSSDGDNWEHLAEARRRVRARQPQVDPRAVFYGRPLLEFVGRECFAASARRGEIVDAVRAQRIENGRPGPGQDWLGLPDEVAGSRLSDAEIAPRTWPGQERYASPFYDTLKRIHAAWLLTPRDDLRGASPREIALDRHDHLVSDMCDRSQQWSLLDECPRGISESSHAFQFAGFGTHELVKYYDLVRELLWSCWDELTELDHGSPGGQRPGLMTVGDFLTVEVPRLEALCKTWLEQPDPESYGRTPQSLIARERARLPEGISGHDAMVAPDCPCCQFLGELSGPVFWHLDASGFDDEFAFDIHHRTREEWEEEQQLQATWYSQQPQREE